VHVLFWLNSALSVPIMVTFEIVAGTWLAFLSAPARQRPHGY
jgi:hypothetical protein